MRRLLPLLGPFYVLPSCTTRRKLLVIACLFVFCIANWPIPTYAVAATDFGFDFRSTVGFVTDPNYASFVDSTQTYPQTYTNGLSLTIVGGWESLNGVNCQSGISVTNRNAGNDPRLAGIAFPTGGNAGGTGFQCIFRVDLPSTGAWTVAFAGGDASNGQNIYVQFADNGSVFATCSNTATTSNHFADANCTVFTEANWITSNTTVTHTFTSTKLEMLVGPNSSAGSNSSTIAFLRVTASSPLGSKIAGPSKLTGPGKVD